MTAGGALLIGAGGLGCGTALALAAAGLRRLGIVENDTVDESNLHRQVLHRRSRIGQPKAESLLAELGARFADLVVTVHATRFTADNALGLLASYDVLVDGSDNLGTKFLANDAAVLARKPLVHGAAVGTTGQLLSVPAGGRPCYRCLFEEQPPADASAPSCSEAGVLGPVPGVIGALQAVEALRFLDPTGPPPALVGRLLRHEATTLETRVVPFRSNPQCAVCGDSPTITALDAARYADEGCAP